MGSIWRRIQRRVSCGIPMRCNGAADFDLRLCTAILWICASSGTYAVLSPCLRRNPCCSSHESGARFIEALFTHNER